MILKYKRNGHWVFISNVYRVEPFEMDAGVLIEKFNEKYPDEYVNSPYDPDVILSNKAFTMACKSFDSWPEVYKHGDNHNALDHHLLKTNKKVACIMALIQEKKGDACYFIITNQDTYLMNDEGKTIEKIN